MAKISTVSPSNIGAAAHIESLLDLLRQRAERQPQDIAFNFSNDGQTDALCVTYAELDAMARAIAARLQQHGAENQRALLLFASGLDFIAAFFGCLYASVIAVPCYPPRATQNLSRVQSIVADAGAIFVLTTSSLRAGILQRIEDSIEVAALTWIATDEIDPTLADRWREPAIDGDSIAFLQYTSGSTGTPKGVVLTHGNLLHNERMIEFCFGHSQRTVAAGWLPLFHDMGLIGNVLQPVYLGIPCTLIAPATFLQRPLRWLQMISRCRATSSGGPNFAYELCLKKITPAHRDTLDLSCWQLAFSGAELVRAETLDRFAEMFSLCGFRREAFYPCYGMAETTLFATGGVKGRPPVYVRADRRQMEQLRARPVSPDTAGSQTIVGVGRPWLGLEIEIVDPHTRERCAPGLVGEIWVAGPSVARGYWNRPRENEAIFRARISLSGEGPFLRTGDLGFLHDGELFVTGRLKDLIVIRGSNHSPEDIELTVADVHPALSISRTAAFSVDVDGEERLVIVAEVERAKMSGVVPATLVAEIREAVAVQHGLQLYAAALVKAGTIPKTSSGKVQRHLCRRQFIDGALQTAPLDLRELSQSDAAA